jgi:hypothetical protein
MEEILHRAMDLDVLHLADNTMLGAFERVCPLIRTYTSNEPSLRPLPTNQSLSKIDAYVLMLGIMRQEWPIVPFLPLFRDHPIFLVNLIEEHIRNHNTLSDTTTKTIVRYLTSALYKVDLADQLKCCELFFKIVSDSDIELVAGPAGAAFYCGNFLKKFCDISHEHTYFAMVQAMRYISPSTNSKMDRLDQYITLTAYINGFYDEEEYIAKLHINQHLISGRNIRELNARLPDHHNSTHVHQYRDAVATPF